MKLVMAHHHQHDSFQLHQEDGSEENHKAFPNNPVGYQGDYSLASCVP